MAVKKEDSKAQLAKQLNVPRSSLYYKPKLPEKDLKLKAQIEKVMAVHKAYGHRRIAIILKINKKRVLRVMKLFNLKPQRKRRKPKKLKDFNQIPMVIPNLIKGTIIEDQNQVWVSDFTYLSYFGKFIYVATVEDIFSRQVIGWEISINHNTDLVANALLNAIVNQYFSFPEIIHSDQGSEYRHKEYLNLLESLDISPSMSAKASPWQNSYQESFYSGFKLELGHPEIYLNLGELIEAIARQIYYYNYERIHLALKCPPAVFAEKCRKAKTRNILIIK
jgi:transposase InsO family protein